MVDKERKLRDLLVLEKGEKKKLTLDCKYIRIMIMSKRKPQGANYKFEIQMKQVQKFKYQGNFLREDEKCDTRDPTADWNGE